MAEIGRIREQFQLLRGKERDSERLDVRVRITAESPVPVELGLERIDLGARESREVVTGDALELRVPGVVRIDVQAPGGIERARLVRDIEAARAAVHAVSLEFGPDDLTKLEDLAEERRRLEGELQTLVASREGLFKNERRAKDAIAELGAARVTIGELLERHPEWHGAPPEAAALVPIEQAVLFERKHFAEAQTTREELLESRREIAEHAAASLTKHEDAIRALKLDIARCEATIRQLESGEGDDAVRQRLLAEALKQTAVHERAIAVLDAELDSLGDPAVRVARISQDKRNLEAQCRQAEEDRVRVTERLDQIRARGIWKDLGDVAEEIERASQDLERERLSADALKLLRDVLVKEQAAAVETAVRPVAERVARMARFLFGPSAKATFGEELAPRALAAEGPDLPVELLSAGTQDQLALLARMALGELYAEKCGRHAFVLDDPLVNCDRDRRGKLLEILAASRALQIVIFTCSPELYRGLPEEKTVFLSVEEAKLRMNAQASLTA
jgi:DNA repair exonuclease SbcCD ATPase subunit